MICRNVFLCLILSDDDTATCLSCADIVLEFASGDPLICTISFHDKNHSLMGTTYIQEHYINFLEATILGFGYEQDRGNKNQYTKTAKQKTDFGTHVRILWIGQIRHATNCSQSANPITGESNGNRLRAKPVLRNFTSDNRSKRSKCSGVAEHVDADESNNTSACC